MPGSKNKKTNKRKDRNSTETESDSSFTEQNAKQVSKKSESSSDMADILNQLKTALQGPFILYQRKR